MIYTSSLIREPEPLSPQAFNAFKKHLPPELRKEAELRQAALIRQKEEAERAGEIKLSKILDEDTLMRFGYVPFVIAKLAWDYADTIIDYAKYLRMKETRPLSRAIRELKVEYDRIRCPYENSAHKENEEENMYSFEDGVKDVFKLYLENVAIDLRCEYPDLDEEYITFLKAVYQCHIVLASLYEYVRQISKKVAEIVGHSIGDVLPKQLRRLDGLVLAFTGDKPVTEKFSSQQSSYAKNIANKIFSVELTGHLEY